MLALGAFHSPSRRFVPTSLRRRRHLQRALVAATLAAAAVLAAPIAASAAPTGQLVWERSYPLAGSGVDHGDAVATGGGHIYVAGSLGRAGGAAPAIALVAYAADGARQWALRYDGPTHAGATAASVAVGRSGEIYVAGAATRNGSRDLVVLKVDPTGELLWQRFCGGRTGPDRATALTVDRSGNVLVTGALSVPGHGLDVVLAKYAPGGQRLWLRTWGGAAHRDDVGNDVAVDRGGNSVVAGWTNLARGTDSAGLLLKYSSAGTVRWVRRQSSGTRGDAFFALALDATGNVFAGGQTRQTGSGVDALLVRYTAAGVQRWKWVVRGMQAGRDQIADVVVDRGGWVHAAGSVVTLGTHPDGLVMSSDPDGSAHTLRTYDGGSHLADAFVAVVCDGASNVVVGGYTTSAAGITRAVVAKYTRDLSQRQWVCPFAGTATGDGNRTAGLAPAPDGVFAVGTLLNTGTGADVALARVQG